MSENGHRKPEDELIKFFQSQQISNDRMHAILKDTESTRPRRGFGRGFSLAIAACVSLMALSVLLHQNKLLSQRTDLVLREAALNHATKLRMDAQADTVIGLQKGLQELPFDIKLPESDFYKKLVLVGGRYCTISGNLAAHLKLASPDKSKQYSLFLTPSAENLKSMNSSEAKISGVAVKLWQEQNVVYAFAKASGE